MAEEFEVKGPEEEQVEHHVEHAKDNFASRVAVLTAILATIGAIFSYKSGHTESEAMIYKNEAAIIKTQASDQWNYYQAKSTKEAIMEGVLLNATDDKVKAKIEGNINKYEKEKAEIKKEAEKLDKESLNKSEESDGEMKLHHRWAEAMTMLQIAISLAAITILTKRRWLFWTSGAVALVGVALGVWALTGL